MPFLHLERVSIKENDVKLGQLGGELFFFFFLFNPAASHGLRFQLAVQFSKL